MQTNLHRADPSLLETTLDTYALKQWTSGRTTKASGNDLHAQKKTVNVMLNASGQNLSVADKKTLFSLSNLQLTSCVQNIQSTFAKIFYRS